MKRVFRLSRVKPDVARDVDDEIRFYLEMRTQEFIDAGLAPDRARQAAVEAFGDVRAIERECRQVTARRVRQRERSEVMQTLWQDLRYAARTLRKSPGFTAAAVLTLALGIGANTALFSVVNGVLLRPLPYARGDQLVLLRQEARLIGVENAGFSVAEVHDYHAQNTTLAGVAEYHNMWFNLLGRAEPERVSTGVVSAEFFDVLGVRPILGRTFRAEDDRLGAEAVLVLSHEYWKRAFGGDSSVIGRTLKMNDRIHTVIGVLPQVPQYPDENDVYMPTSACPFRSSQQMIESRTGRMMSLYGRLKDDVTLGRANADISMIAGRMQQQYPEAYPQNLGFAGSVLSLEQELTRSFRPTLLVLVATAGFVLLIVCASVANLSLSRLVRRERELAIRTAMGAGRGRLLRQLLAESTLLALVAGAVGLGLAFGALGLLTEFAARFTPRAREIGIDGTVLLFTLAMSLGTGVVFGALPALLSRMGNLATTLKEGSGRASAGARKHRVRNVLIVAQVAVSFMLLIGAGLMLRSLIKLQQVDPGFRPDNVLTMTLDMDFTKYNTPPLRAQYMERLLERVGSLPGIVAASTSGTFPLNEQGPGRARFQVEGRPVDPAQPLPQADLRVASPDYFRVIGIPLVAGRYFTAQDHLESPRVGIINQTMARHYWPNEDPIGRRLVSQNGQQWAEIVGVVGDAKQQLNAEVGDELYRPFAQTPYLSTTFLVRTAGDPRTIARRVVEAVYSVDPEQPVANVRTLEEVRAESLASPRLTAILLALFGALALVITATGIAGVIAFSVSQRTQEIGIRMALGARQRDVLRMVVGQGLVLVFVGLALGLAGAFALARVMTGLLFEVGVTDPVTYLTVALVLVAVAATACLVPAHRATVIDPLVALRAG